ncbi:MAG TPA: ATP-binding protein, partial [Chromatiales bacterium]|nr:ATP-binding protein [Chromatiales bacterium]
MAAGDNALANEIDWFSRVLDSRIRLYFEQGCEVASISEITPPPLKDD